MPNRHKTIVNTEILLVSDNSEELAHVRQLLSTEHGAVLNSGSETGGLALFRKHHPALLIVAFETISNAEAFYLSLYRQDSKIYRAPHKTLLLCKGVESKQAYELCINGIFNDYVADRPLFDPYRLNLSVTQALKQFHIEQGAFWLSQHLEQINTRMHRFNRLIADRLQQGASQQKLSRSSLHAFAQRLSEDLEQLEANLITLQNEKELVAGAELKQVGEDMAHLRQQKLPAEQAQLASRIEQADEWRQQLAHEQQQFQQNLPPDPARNGVIEVLLVDDDDLYRETLITMLNSDNMHVMGVSDGRSALHSLQVYKPDVILLNYQMPDMDGLAVLQALRGQVRTRSIPVIMLDSDSSKDVMKECIEAGVSLFIVKPSDRSTILSHIDQALKNS